MHKNTLNPTSCLEGEFARIFSFDRCDDRVFDREGTIFYREGFIVFLDRMFHGLRTAREEDDRDEKKRKNRFHNSGEEKKLGVVGEFFLVFEDMGALDLARFVRVIFSEVAVVENRDEVEREHG